MKESCVLTGSYYAKDFVDKVRNDDDYDANGDNNNDDGNDGSDGAVIENGAEDGGGDNDVDVGGDNKNDGEGGND